MFFFTLSHILNNWLPKSSWMDTSLHSSNGQTCPSSQQQGSSRSSQVVEAQWLPCTHPSTVRGELGGGRKNW